MTRECVCAVAEKYGLDISDLNIKIDKARDGFAGVTSPNGTVTLTRAAFRNEEQLARTLAHEQFHVGQLQSGMPYPKTLAAAQAYETPAYAFEEAWWVNHPLNGG
jgi:hypothetical protein